MLEDVLIALKDGLFLAYAWVLFVEIQREAVHDFVAGIQIGVEDLGSEPIAGNLFVIVVIHHDIQNL